MSIKLFNNLRKNTDKPQTEILRNTTPIVDSDIAFSVRDLSLYYGDFQALRNINIDIKQRSITAFIGPSGCGKSTLLRCFNRMNDLIESSRVEGQIIWNGQDINSPDTDVVKLRTEVGMVFQQPNPFPKSIFDNVAYGLVCQGVKNKSVLRQAVEESLKKAALWDEVKDHLKRDAGSLSGGQQQRLCIARAIALSPQIILMDEPPSALDPIATSRIEDLITEIKNEYTIIIVTHSMSQAARVSDETAFFLLGDLIEFDTNDVIFQNPGDSRTEDYISGKFG